MLKRILFIGFLLPISWLYAQTDYKSGYVITNSNDTLYGEIDYRGDRLMKQRCKFRSEQGDVEYTPYDIAGYRFCDSKYFVSKEVSGNRIFLEFLIKGQVNIYYMRDETGDHYYIDKEDMPLTEIPYEEGIRTIDGVQRSYRSLSHIRILNHYMFDAPVVQKQIGNMKKPAHNELIKLAENYHHAVCTNGESCIVFEKKQPSTKITLNVVGGGTNYYTGKSSFTGGVLLDFWMPRINEKLYLRTGLLHSKHDFDYDDTEVPSHYNPKSAYKIPFIVEYIYPKSVIKPKIAYGPGIVLFNKRPGLIVTCMGGFNINLNASLGILLEYHADFTEVFFVFPRQFISHTFLGGFYYRF